MSKMIKCKTCGADIAAGAKTCPKCRAKNKKPIFTKWWFWLIVVIFIAALAGGGGDSNKDEAKPTTTEVAEVKEEVKEEPKDEVKEEPKEEPKEEVIVVSAEDLAKAFEDNEISANKQYKDKILEVTGTVQDIGEVLGSTYISLDSGEEFSITHAQCFFKDEDQIDKVAELSKGDTVTLIGKCEGKSLTVEVKNCKFK